jgi:D-alanine transfer protein
LRPAHSSKPRARKWVNAEDQHSESFDVIRPARDRTFRARIASSNEWTDLELLFRTLAEIKAEPLILSMPFDAYAARGVSHSTRELYYDRMRELAEQYHFPLIEFEQRDADPRFLIAHREHPTPRGWMVYNRALDDFFRKSK